MTDRPEPFPPPSRYERSKTMAMYWHNKASDLRGSAGLVWAGMHDQQALATAVSLGLGRGFDFRVACWPPYLMLCGLSLELLLKATFVADGQRPPVHHRLVDLWTEVGLSLTSSERGLLQILTESVYWAGRYPVPNANRAAKAEADFKRYEDLSLENLWDEIRIGEGELVVKRANANLDWESYSRLWSAAHKASALRRFFDPPRSSTR